MRGRSRQCRHVGLKVRAGKIRDRQPAARVLVDDAMDRRFEQVVGPALERVADIDIEGAPNRRNDSPRTVFLHQLKTCNVIFLRKDREAAIIGMGSATDIRMVFDLGLSRVVVDSHVDERPS